MLRKALEEQSPMYLRETKWRFTWILYVVWVRYMPTYHVLWFPFKTTCFVPSFEWRVCSFRKKKSHLIQTIRGTPCLIIVVPNLIVKQTSFVLWKPNPLQKVFDPVNWWVSILLGVHRRNFVLFVTECHKTCQLSEPHLISYINSTSLR